MGKLCLCPRPLTIRVSVVVCVSLVHGRIVEINPLTGTLNRRATDHYTAIRWLVRWPLMGGCYVWYSDEEIGRARVPHSPLTANMAPRYLTAQLQQASNVGTGSVYSRRRRPSSMFLAPNTWPSVAVRSVQLQLVWGTVCQQQCSLLSHWTFFNAAWKLNCWSVLTTDTAPVKRLYCCVTHYHLPAAFCCGCNLEVYRL